MIAALATAAALVWLFAPGLAVGWAVGMRGLSLLALSPALTLAALGGGSLVAPWLGLDWNWLTALGATAFGAAVAWAVARIAPIRAPRLLPRWSRRDWLAVAGGAVAAAAFIYATNLAAMGGAGGLPHSGDLVFHGNLLRFILETGNASPFHAGTLNAPASASAYYPSGLHAIAALAPAATQVWPALNMVRLVAGSVVWVLGVVYLARVLFGGRPKFALAAAALAVLYQGQPTSMVPLMANTLGAALLPALLGWSVQLARVVTVATKGRVARSLILLVAVVGAAFAHPAAMFAYAAVASPIAVYIVWTVALRGWRSGYRVATVAGVAALAALLVGAALAIYAVPEVKSVLAFGGWVGSTNVFVAGAMALTDSTSLFQIGPNLLVTAGLAAGAWAALRRRSRRWLILSFAVVTVLYVGAVAKIKLLEPLTGLFYSDRTRLGPLLAVAGIPLMLWGLDWALGVWRGRPKGPARRWIAAVGALGLASAVCLTAVRPFRVHLLYYDLGVSAAAAERRFFDADEYAMIGRLAGELDPGAAVLGDPANGSAFLYSLAAQPVVFTHVTGKWDEPRRYLLEHFGDLGHDAGVCSALAELGVEYVYLDSRAYGGIDTFADMTNGLTVEGNLELVDSGGAAAVYRITACD
ncbi:MAG: hypothetical protein LBD77_01040 [Bifidobacteriaceae bacterium]|nr:hypothetical protein [Bifidobacteriaceae bacterium]